MQYSNTEFTEATSSNKTDGKIMHRFQHFLLHGHDLSLDFQTSQLINDLNSDLVNELIHSFKVV